MILKKRLSNKLTATYHNYALQRISSQKDSTNGILFFIPPNNEWEFICYTLEDEHRDRKVAGETRIPAGDYELKLRTFGGHHQKYSSRFKDIHRGMIEVMGVVGFTDILFHCGNTDEDTAGCILCGISQHSNISKRDGFIGGSTEAYFYMYPHIAEKLSMGDRVFLNIIDLA